MSAPGTPSWRDEQAAALLDFARRSVLPDDGFGWPDDHGDVDPTQDRPLFLTARAVYCWSLAYLRTGAPAALSAVTGGLRSLQTRFADHEYGGWFAALDGAGTVTDTSKMNYAHAQVLFAAATALGAGIDAAQPVVDEAVRVIEARFYSDDEGAAQESWDAAFSTPEDYRGANSNMHSVEAYLVAGDVLGDPVWHQRALSIAGRLIDTQARAHGWRIPEHYDVHWQPLLDYNDDHRDDQFRPFGVSPGHSFEWARLLVALEQSLLDPPAWLLEAALGLFDVATQFGWAPDATPGFVYTLDMADRPVVASRLHWVACEAVLAADSLARRTGEERYQELVQRWWAHLDEHFLDRRNGGWYQELTPVDGSLRPSDGIWSGKPDVYHSYQALLFGSLPLAPCAALSLGGEGTAA